VIREARILFIDFTNYEDYPIGGYLSFAKNMMDAFGSQLALVGISTNPDEPVGQWFKKNIGDIEFDFFALAKYKKSKTKHIIPDRLATYFLVKLNNKKINDIGIKNVFLQRQEILLALRTLSKNICFSFAGAENPLSISKYWYGKLLARNFERYFFEKLRIATVILVRGDDSSIADLIKRSDGAISPDSVIKFPTRINTEIFRPLSKEEARSSLSLPLSQVIIVTTGRLSEFKGWRFLIDCVKEFSAQVADPKLYFIGEGEDYYKIKAYISECNMGRHVLLSGKKSQQHIALYLNAADLFIMGSVKEGWSTSLMEAIACGVPSCVTEFSSAADIVIDGVNGYVASAGDRKRFVECMVKSLKLLRPVRNDHVVRYSTRNLKTDILKYWNLS